MLILNDLIKYIKDGEKDSKKLGLEIEHFVIDDNGNQILFDEVTKLIDEVSTRISAKKYITDGYVVGYDTGEYTVTLEPACQFEISIYPHENLKDIIKIYNEFYEEWNTIFSSRGYKIISSGNLPNVELGIISPDDIPLSPKLRYKYMNQHFEKTGKYGKYMMRASGSTQVSIDYDSEQDMIRKLRILEIISPILMIMMENKQQETSSLPGVIGKNHLLRIQEWEDLDSARTGYFPKSFDEDFGYESIANTILNTPLILLSNDGETTYVGDKTALDLINEGVVDYDSLSEKERVHLLEHFISMGFFHYRIKRYIEIRIADAVAIDKAVAYAALLKGLLYNKSSLSKLEKLFENIKQIDAIQDATFNLEKDGWEADIYGKKAKDWSGIIIDIAYNSIDNEERAYLDLLR